jgi:hypothetical protein
VGMALLGTMYPAAHPVQWGHCTAKRVFRMSAGGQRLPGT